MDSIQFKMVQVEDIPQKITHPFKKRRSQIRPGSFAGDYDTVLTDIIRDAGWALSELSCKMGKTQTMYKKFHDPWRKMTMEDIFFIAYLTDLPYHVIWGACYSPDQQKSARDTGKKKAQALIAAKQKVKEERESRANLGSWG